MSRVRRTGGSAQLLALAADDLPAARLECAALTIKQLKRKCDQYFALLDQPNPPGCLLADYEAACEELDRRRSAAIEGTLTPV